MIRRNFLERVVFEISWRVGSRTRNEKSRIILDAYAVGPVFTQQNIFIHNFFICKTISDSMCFICNFN